MEAESRTTSSKATEQFRKLCQISDLLNTGLTPKQLYLCQKVIKKGINPEALAHSIKVIREELKKVETE